MARTLIQFVGLLFNLYSVAIIIRTLLPWFGVDYYNPIMRFLIQITEPLLAPLRGYVPPVGGLDFTPMIALILLWVFEQLLQILILAVF